ncbi:MAG TPA: hypothetical protein VJL59_06245, partial [Anaerolineales bacterium]|nr:hypothetical protein [Anaerolineales bacterium]
VMALYQGRNEEVRLTADSFIHLKNRTQTALRLNEITSVRSVWHSSGRRGHWAVLIADGTGRTIELDLLSCHSLCMVSWRSASMICCTLWAARQKLAA